MAVWDVFLIEGDIGLFKAAFALMELDPEELTPESFTKAYFKYKFITKKRVKRLRKKHRHSTIEEHSTLHGPNKNSEAMDNQQSSLFRRVKLLSKFNVLNKAFRNQRYASINKLSKEELKLDYEIK